MSAAGPGADPVSDYLDRLESPECAAFLRHVREVILAEVPDAEPVISYGLPAFKVRGRVFCGFAATTSGCSLYPFSGSTLSTLGALLDGYSTTKSAIHVSPGHPVPDDLVRELVRVRLAEIDERGR